jgi:hypothetical protein
MHMSTEKKRFGAGKENIIILSELFLAQQTPQLQKPKTAEE